MRIGFYTFSFLPIIGGAEILLHGLAESLTQRGHEVTVWAPKVRGEDNRVSARYRLCRYARPSSKRFGVRQTLPRVLLAAWGRRADVLHCHGAYPAGYVGATLKRLTGVPLVIRPHGSDILPGEWIASNPRLVVKMQRALRAADVVVAQSGSLAMRLRELGVPAERLRLIHNGVRLPAGTPDLLPDEPSVFAMGSLSRKKGFDILLQAFRLVRERVRGASLTLAGEGPEKARLAALASSLGIGDAVTFAGVVTGEVKAALFQRARSFVSSSRREPFGNATLEAMAAGRPIVATRVGGHLELLEDEVSGLLVEPEDAEGLARAIVMLLEDRKRAAEMGRAALARAQAFSWDGMVDKYEGLYRELAMAPMSAAGRT